MGQSRSKPLSRVFNHTISGSVLGQWRQDAIATCHAHDISPTEVDWLLQQLTDLDRLTLRLGHFRTQPVVALEVSFDVLKDRWQQRVDARLPIQYIVGKTEWRQFTLTVSPAVLIPRPETELLIDLAIAAATNYPEYCTGRWVDLGAGSGAIALGLADAFPMAQIHGVDCSAAALAIAQHNAAMNAATNELSIRTNSTQTQNPAHSIHWHQGSWFSPFAHHPIQFSGIVSNPPYIPSAMVLDLQPEVVNHEPHLALDGGVDGLDCIRQLIQTAPTYLMPNGVLLMEMMAGQADTVVSLLEQQGHYHHIEIHADLAGIQRFACAYRVAD